MPSVTYELGSLWTSDPLRSFGVLIPFVCCAFMANTWSRLHWERRGTSWGLLPILSAIAFARLTTQTRISLHVHGLQFDPMQPGLLLSAFFSGVLLLIGGTRLWRASLFPLCLLFAVNPIPHIFTQHVDLPLQTLSAAVARHFAFALGLHPTGKQLDLLFTPVLGMTIVPGCDGMRGAATLAYGVLLIGYVRRYRAWKLAGMVAAASLLGYLLNFLRLCILVVYYWIAFHHPSLSADGVIVDYMIGGSLFVLVGLLAGTLWLGGQSADDPNASQFRVVWPAILRKPRIVSAFAVLLVAACSALPSAYALLHKPSGWADPAVAGAAMPQAAGAWKLVRVFSEDFEGRTVWEWATFADMQGRSVDLGIWLRPTRHRAIDSLHTQGKPVLWEGDSTAVAAHGLPMHFRSMTALDQVAGMSHPVPVFLSETTCLVSGCSETVGAEDSHLLSIRSGYELNLPVLLRVQHLDGSAALSPVQRAEDEALIADFLRNVDLRALVQRVGHAEPR